MALVYWVVKHKENFKVAIGPESGIPSLDDPE